MTVVALNRRVALDDANIDPHACIDVVKLDKGSAACFSVMLLAVFRREFECAAVGRVAADRCLP